MKKRIVVLMLTAMALTFGSVSAMASGGNQEPEERPGYVWVVDREEQGHYENVLVSAEEGHMENVLISPEEGHTERVLVSPEEGHHETVVIQEEKGHYEEVPVTKPIYETQNHVTCGECGFWVLGYVTDDDVATQILLHTVTTGHTKVIPERQVEVQVGTETVYERQWVVDQPEQTEQKWVVDKEAVYEDKWVVDKEAVYEERWVVDKEAVYEQQWIVDVPEQGHWEPADPEQPTEPTDPEQPTEPADPEQPTEPADPEEPATPDSEKDDSQQEAVTTPEAPAADNKDKPAENTSASGTGTAAVGTVTAPQTGDPGSLGYIVSLAGSALASGSALVWKFKRKK